MASNGMMTVNDELEGMGKEAFMVCFTTFAWKD
jgi:hypothetical protein